MPFTLNGADPKNLIQWTDLAPSFQELFKFMQTQIYIEKQHIATSTSVSTALQTEVNYRKQKVTELESLIASLSSNTQDPRIQTLLNDGKYMDGMILKLDSVNNKIYADDGYRNICVVENDAELDQMKGVVVPIDLTDVFNSWYRYAHYCSDSRNALNSTAENTFLGGSGTFIQNTGACADYLNKWTHNMTSNPKSITCTVDWSPTCGFVSNNDFYTNYYLRVKYNESDDDFCFICVGFYKDSSGIEHTLSIVSCTIGGGTKISWAFIYDLDCPTQHIIKDFTSVVGNGGGHGDHYISAKRSNSSFVFKKSPANSSVDNEAWTIKWEYPSTKPSDMTAAEYENIGKMLDHGRIGVGVVNMPCTFYIADQNAIFDEQNIYALHTDDVYSYKSGTGWYISGKIKDTLPDRTFIYNPYLKKLIYRRYAKDWTYIKTND